MPASNSTMIHRLQTAINKKFGAKILVNRSQWFSEKQDRPVTTWVIRKAIWDAEKERTRSVEIFKSTSQIQIVLFLRDMWYKLNGWDMPPANEEWEKIRKDVNFGGL